MADKKAQNRAGGTPPPVTPPTPTFLEDFKKGEKLRDGTVTTGSEYDKEIDSPLPIPAKSAALFDGQGMDPYEVNNAK